jgi:hypothetical protein
MNTPAPADQPVEVLVELRGQGQGGFDSAMDAVAALGARILHSYRPLLAVVVIPAARLAALRACSRVQSVFPDQVGQDALKALPEEMRWAAQAWNMHLSEKEKAGAAPPRPSTSNGLPWDAPGHLPPDPPPEIQAELKRRSFR